jgi:hypothetical protein
VKKSSHKRFNQRQLTEIFCRQIAVPDAEISYHRNVWWANPTDPDSLRLTMEGLRLVIKDLGIKPYEFLIETEVTNAYLLKLERYFPSMYFLLKREKFIVFEESEAVMLTLQGDLQQYLDNLESQN